MNPCKFSPCRRYRYELIHKIDEVAPHPEHGDTFLPWIGLYPGDGDETRLDAGLTRMRSITAAAGFNHLVALNLFARKVDDTDGMNRVTDIVGRDNDATISEWARKSPVMVAAWGEYHGHISRWRKVVELVKWGGARFYAVGVSPDGTPWNVIHAKKGAALFEWTEPKEIIEDFGDRLRRARYLNKRKQR